MRTLLCLLLAAPALAQTPDPLVYNPALPGERAKGYYHQTPDPLVYNPLPTATR